MIPPGMECISIFLVLAAKPTSLGTRVPKVCFFFFKVWTFKKIRSESYRESRKEEREERGTKWEKRDGESWFTFQMISMPRIEPDLAQEPGALSWLPSRCQILGPSSTEGEP